MSLAAGAPTLTVGAWLGAALVGVALGVAAALSLEHALAGAVVLVALYALARAQLRSELVLAAFWVTFCVYETIFSSVTVPGLFYPFYAAFALAVMVSLLRRGVAVEAWGLWLYGGFLFVVLLAFLGFTEPVGFEVAQRVFAYAFGLLVMLQIGTRRGVRPVLVAALCAGVAIAVWVIAASAQAGFRYRGDVSVDQNVASFFIGFGVLVALAFAVDLMRRRHARLTLLLALVPLAAMLYAMTLLASRGIAIALTLGVLAIIARAAMLDVRTLRVALLLLPLSAGAALLPGGDHLLERFALADTETGNERLPIWAVTSDAFTRGDVYELLLGHGFGSSQVVVQRASGSLTSTHNAFLQILFEFGVVGFALFVALHALLIVRAFRLGGGSGLALFGWMWYLLGANLSLNTPDGFLYWTALGVALSLGRWREAPTAPPPQATRPTRHSALTAP